ncbi:MAG: 30S ribosomal protein S7 [Deltaproteobacteria bacterium]|nr:30S ribosomal protein S7 [Deltaproteobacteria bacterium]
MARRKREYAKRVMVDPIYGEVVVAKFINSMMWDGKKSVAEATFYGALDRIKDRFKEEGVEIFKRALDNVRPLVEVRSRRVGGATYQVPTEVRAERKNTLAIRWLVQEARNRSEKSMVEKLANEVYDAAQNRGNAVKRKEETHRMAEANRAFAHYRW